MHHDTFPAAQGQKTKDVMNKNLEKEQIRTIVAELLLLERLSSSVLNQTKSDCAQIWIKMSLVCVMLYIKQTKILLSSTEMFWKAVADNLATLSEIAQCSSTCLVGSQFSEHDNVYISAKLLNNALRLNCTLEVMPVWTL